MNSLVHVCSSSIVHNQLWKRDTKEAVKTNLLVRLDNKWSRKKTFTLHSNFFILKFRDHPIVTLNPKGYKFPPCTISLITCTCLTSSSSSTSLAYALECSKRINTCRIMMTRGTLTTVKLYNKNAVAKHHRR